MADMSSDDTPWYAQFGNWLVNTSSSLYQQYLDGENNEQTNELNAQIQQSQAQAQAQTNRILIIGGAALLATLLVVALKK